MLAFLLAACEQATLQSSEAGDRELGRVEAIYPRLADSDAWYLEYRLTADTVFVDYLEARALVEGDSAWRAALTTSKRIFFDNGESCMYAAEVPGCLPFLDNLPRP
jgi:hypothetical protein